MFCYAQIGNHEKKKIIENVHRTPRIVRKFVATSLLKITTNCTICRSRTILATVVTRVKRGSYYDHTETIINFVDFSVYFKTINVII